MPRGYWLQCTRCKVEHVEPHDPHNGAESLDDATVMASWVMIPTVGTLCSACRKDAAAWVMEGQPCNVSTVEQGMGTLYCRREKGHPGLHAQGAVNW